MKAAEARALSNKKAAAIQKAKDAEAAKRKVARDRQAKAAHAKFCKEFQEKLDDYIKSGVEDGEKSARVYVSYNCDSPREAQEGYDKHPYLADIKRMVLKLNRDGYKTTTGHESTKHTTQHESSVPDYDYYEHHYYIEISWK